MVMLKEMTHYTDPANLPAVTGTLGDLSVPVNLTGAWANLGGEIDPRSYAELILYVKLDINDSQNVRFRVVGRNTSGGDSYLTPIRLIGSTDIKVDPEYQEINTDADQNIILKFSVPTCRFVQVQVMAAVAGATPGQVDEIKYSLAYKSEVGSDTFSASLSGSVGITDGVEDIAINTDGSINTKIIGALIDKAYDYVGVSWNGGTFTEVFTFKTGGAGGTTQYTVTVVYTDATKEQLVTVTRT